MFPSPFPSEVAFRCFSEEQYPTIELHPEEEQYLGPRTVEIRKKHFRLGRAAAHQAILDLTGKPAGPILTGKRREPIWPADLVGTISHSGAFACAAVAYKSFAIGIGYDIEFKKKTINPEISRLVCHDDEADWVNSGNTVDEVDANLRTIFCAKESIFKAFYPIERVELAFKDVKLEWDAEQSAFRGRLLRNASQQYREGHLFSVPCQSSQGYVRSSLLLEETSSQKATLLPE